MLLLHSAGILRMIHRHASIRMLLLLRHRVTRVQCLGSILDECSACSTRLQALGHAAGVDATRVSAC